MEQSLVLLVQGSNYMCCPLDKEQHTFIVGEPILKQVGRGSLSHEGLAHEAQVLVGTVTRPSSSSQLWRDEGAQQMQHCWSPVVMEAIACISVQTFLLVVQLRRQ